MLPSQALGNGYAHDADATQNHYRLLLPERQLQTGAYLRGVLPPMIGKSGSRGISSLPLARSIRQVDGQLACKVGVVGKQAIQFPLGEFDSPAGASSRCTFSGSTASGEPAGLPDLGVLSNRFQTPVASPLQRLLLGRIQLNRLERSRGKTYWVRIQIVIPTDSNTLTSTMLTDGHQTTWPFGLGLLRIESVHGLRLRAVASGHYSRAAERYRSRRFGRW